MAGKPFKRKGSRRWYVVVEIPPTGGKKREQRWLSGATRREVEEKQRALLREIDTGGTLDPTTMTVAEFLDHWLETTARPNLAPTTYQRYRRNIRLHLAPHIGNVPVIKLTPLHLVRCYAQLGERLAAGTVGNTHTMLHGALDQAVRWLMIPRNVCDAVEPPRRRRTPPKLWDDDQLAAFLAAIADDRHGAYWHLAIATGMRRGELLGLRWSAIDLDRSVLHVQRALSRQDDGSLIEALPKTRAGRRAISLLPETVAVLRAHRRRQLEQRLAAGPEWREDNLVFTRPDGRPIPPSTIQGRWERLLVRHGLPYIRPHDLRHTHATVLLRRKVHPKIVQARLGHSSSQVTMDIYSHVLDGMQEEALAQLADLFAPPKPAPAEGGEQGQI